jgi:hypothetical protein
MGALRRMAVLLSLTIGAAFVFAQPAPKVEAARTLVRAGHLLDVKTGKLWWAKPFNPSRPALQSPRSLAMR